MVAQVAGSDWFRQVGSIVVSIAVLSCHRRVVPRGQTFCGGGGELERDREMESVVDQMGFILQRPEFLATWFATLLCSSACWVFRNGL